MLKPSPDPIRVVVVEDSPTVRELLVAILQGASGIQVVGVGSNGEDAVRLTRRMQPDVVTMDVHMPGVDGLEATRRIMRETPTPIVIVSAGLAQSNTDIAFEALRAGALTVVRSPGLGNFEGSAKVIQAVRLMAGVAVVRRWDRTQRPETPTPPPTPASRIAADNHRGVQMIGIAASTGGPGALATILRQLPVEFPAPILVVQHVAQGFVDGLAEWLDGETPLHVGLASHGDTPQPGDVLIAPDEHHLQVNARGAVELCTEPPYKRLRPSANYLFRSLARAYGPRAVGVVLTGMGDDGSEGMAALHNAGGLTLAQDEASCVVYGMPGEAVARNVVDRVLNLDQIALTLNQLLAEQRREKDVSDE